MSCAARVQHNTINGFIRVPADALLASTIPYYGDNASNQTVNAKLQIAVSAVIHAKRAAFELHLRRQGSTKFLDAAGQLRHEFSTTGGAESASALGDVLPPGYASSRSSST